MDNTVSKSEFKPHALKYFRQIKDTGQELIITDRSKPVIRIIPFHEKPKIVLQELRNSIQFYLDPLDPVAENEWKALK